MSDMKIMFVKRQKKKKKQAEMKRHKNNIDMAICTLTFI